MGNSLSGPSKAFNKFLVVFLGGYLKKKFNITAETNDIENLKPPYIIIANHPGFWDPFILSIWVPYPVQFVASDSYFRKPLLRSLLRLVGAIPKSKFMTDSLTVKRILQVKNRGGVIGIFPEGTRSWNGKNSELLYPTAKLIKSLKIPVISVVFRGGFLSHPRWAKKPRKGAMKLVYRLLFDGQSAGNYSADEVFEIITKSIQHDDYEYQREKMIPFKGRRLAERLGLFLFTCPECKSIGKMKSVNDTFSCLNCGYTVRYDEFGYFNSPDGKQLYFNSPPLWDEWQLKYLEEYISAKKSDDSIVENSSVLLKIGYKFAPLKSIRIGTIKLSKEALYFKSRLRESYSFPLKKITGLNVQRNDLFEFYYENTLYQFNFKLANDSAYKWIHAIEIAAH
ncbi:MAG: lysophospholipid acyltransferase family protein [Eubacteriales bacterium]|nr:lysophospholipid acyltransferase family protein [Eubacteriales bacterium]